MLPDIPLDFVKEVSQMFIDCNVSVALVNNNLSCTTVGPDIVIITVWWSVLHETGCWLQINCLKG